jgi:hypothetical protein
MRFVEFGPTIHASERAKTVHALDRSATVTGVHPNNIKEFSFYFTEYKPPRLHHKDQWVNVV